MFGKLISRVGKSDACDEIRSAREESTVQADKGPFYLGRFVAPRELTL